MQWIKQRFWIVGASHPVSFPKTSLRYTAMKAKWVPASVCAVILALGLGAAAQDNGNSNEPTLQTRPNDSTPPPQQEPAPSSRRANSTPAYNAPPSGPLNAVPDGTRFIVKLRDTLDTHDMQQGQHFTAELREELVTPVGLVIPKGRTIKGHVATFERGYTGARIQLALDEIETRKGWVPLIATVTGVPGDPSIKSAAGEGDLYRKGPDMKKVLTNAAIGAAVGAVSGSVAGGSKGAAVGAAAGAGLGSGSGFLLKGSDLKLDQGTQLEVRLDRDLVVPRH
jgi:hypothetical protein